MSRRTFISAFIATIILYGLLYATIFIIPQAFAQPPQNVTDTQTIRQLYAVANTFWHADPHCQTTEVFVEPSPQGTDWTGWAIDNGCTIWLTPNIWQNLQPSGENSLIAESCTTFLHEYGHNLGAQHTDDPRQIMYPDENRHIPTICTEWANERVNTYLTTQEQQEKEATQHDKLPGHQQRNSGFRGLSPTNAHSRSARIRALRHRRRLRALRLHHQVPSSTSSTHHHRR